MRFPFAILGLVFLVSPIHAHPDPSHTLEEIDRHLADSPDDPDLLKRKAELFLQTGHVREAIPIAVRLLTISPDDPTVLLLQARVSMVRGKQEDALRRLEEINLRFPTFGEGWAVMAGLLHSTGHTDEAISARLRQLETRDHTGPGDILSAVAWLGERGNPGDAETSVTLLDQGIASFGNVIELQRTAIHLECSLARYDAALKRVDTLVARYRPSVAFSLLRVDIHEAAGNHREAASACDSAIALLDTETNNQSLAPLRESIIRRKEMNLRK